MSQVISGTGADLPKLDEVIVKEFIESKYPTSAIDPIKSKIKFSTMGFSTKSYSITFEGAGVTPTVISNASYKVIKYVSRVVIHIWCMRNKPEIPQQLYTMQNQVEKIINTNTRGLSYGITSFKLVEMFGQADIGFFSAGGQQSNATEMSTWHNQCIVELVYFKAITQE